MTARKKLLLPDSDLICNSCCKSFLKWYIITEFAKVLDQIETKSNEITDIKVRLSIVDLGIMY